MLLQPHNQCHSCSYHWSLSCGNSADMRQKQMEWPYHVIADRWSPPCVRWPSNSRIWFSDRIWIRRFFSENHSRFIWCSGDTAIPGWTIRTPFTWFGGAHRLGFAVEGGQPSPGDHWGGYCSQWSHVCEISFLILVVVIGSSFTPQMFGSRTFFCYWLSYLLTQCQNVEKELIHGTMLWQVWNTHIGLITSLILCVIIFINIKKKYGDFSGLWFGANV